jgi:hypothetical protein
MRKTMLDQWKALDTATEQAQIEWLYNTVHAPLLCITSIVFDQDKRLKAGKVRDSALRPDSLA